MNEARPRARWRRLAILCAMLLTPAIAAAGDGVHLGVATCATGVCHGKLVKQHDSDVWLNEYRVWSADDRHARAYLTLASPAAKAIAARLGLASAQTAKVCLDCHTDNVPQQQRGAKFRISEGVTCEACHGGAEAWLRSHAERGATHAANLAKGLYPTEQPVARAELCLRCHMGDADRYATHAIMGAGHPRLSFEPDAFGVDQPMHYEVDADYVQRKGDIDPFAVWLAGQLVGAQRLLALQSSAWFEKPAGRFPEVAFYDCQSCHHTMDDRRWSAQRAGTGMRPGMLRLNDDHLGILVAVTGVLEPGQRDVLAGNVQALLRGGQRSAAAVKAAAQTLSRWVDARVTRWTTTAVDRATIAAVRRALLAAAANGTLSDYGAAEQVFIAVDGISLQLGDADRLRPRVDALYKSVEDDQTYRPDRFAGAARALLDGL